VVLRPRSALAVVPSPQLSQRLDELLEELKCLIPIECRRAAAAPEPGIREPGTQNARGSRKVPYHLPIGLHAHDVVSADTDSMGT
jgi:hypothetical protein